ncbi:hypothetical protein JTB14_025071 [Gonioctena quinquepunctata]|nr:hypothetical protein JTB14_025071 [Gonioctena quinquepunctata]
MDSFTAMKCWNITVRKAMTMDSGEKGRITFGLLSKRPLPQETGENELPSRGTTRSDITDGKTFNIYGHVCQVEEETRDMPNKVKECLSGSQVNAHCRQWLDMHTDINVIVDKA